MIIVPICVALVHRWQLLCLW